jgi:hypothetical protein
MTLAHSAPGSAHTAGVRERRCRERRACVVGSDTRSQEHSSTRRCEQRWPADNTGGRL